MSWPAFLIYIYSLGNSVQSHLKAGWRRGEEGRTEEGVNWQKGSSLHVNIHVYKWCDVSYIFRNKIINDNIDKLKWGDILLMTRIGGSHHRRHWDRDWDWHWHWDWDSLKIFLRGVVHLEVGCSMGPKISVLTLFTFFAVTNFTFYFFRCY